MRDNEENPERTGKAEQRESMQSVGTVLREKRKEANISYEEVARNTNIPHASLRGMEEEDFSSLPAEVYLLGFLRNYAEYLGLDPELIVSLYQKGKIRDMPTPEELLLPRPKKKNPIPWIVLILIISGGLGFGLYVLRGVKKTPVKKDNSGAVKKKEQPVKKKAVLRKTDQSGEKTYVLNEGQKDYRFLLDKSDKLVVRDRTLGEILFDIRKMKGMEDRTPSVRIYSPTLKEAGVDVFELLLKQGDEKFVFSGNDRESEKIKFSLKVTGPDEVRLLISRMEFKKIRKQENPGEPVKEKSAGNSRPFKVLLTSKVPRTYNLEIRFMQGLLLEYKPRGEEPRIRFYNKGETLDIDVNKDLTLGASNGGGLEVRINKKTGFLLGKNGTVVVKNLRWISNPSMRRYELRIDEAE